MTGEPLGPSLREVARRPSAIALALGTFLLEVGMSAQFVALGKRVFDISQRELDLGLVGLAEFLPIALLVVVAGSTADRRDRRRVAAAALGVEAVLSVALAFEVSRDEATLGQILVLVLGYSTARAFLSPAHRALPATIVEPLALPRMNALYIGSFQAGVIVGPVLAGLLYARGVALPFVLSAVCLAAAAGLLLTLKIRPGVSVVADEGPRESGIRQAFEGLRVIRREPVLLGAISLDLFAVLFGGAVALLPAIAEKRLGVGVEGLGWLRAAIGIGAATTTVTLAFRPVVRRVGATLFAVVGIFGAATIVFGYTHTYAVAFVALMIAAAADSVSVFIRSTLVPLVTPNAVRGRVGAVENVFIGASNELGQFESGVAGQLLGAGPAVMAGGALTLLVVATWPLLFPAIRNLDGFPHPVDEEPVDEEPVDPTATSPGAAT